MAGEAVAFLLIDGQASPLGYRIRRRTRFVPAHFAAGGLASGEGRRAGDEPAQEYGCGGSTHNDSSGFPHQSSYNVCCTDLRFRLIIKALFLLIEH
jgi:hypothetical protein